jgi:hypothetical protein
MSPPSYFARSSSGSPCWFTWIRLEVKARSFVRRHIRPMTRNDVLTTAGCAMPRGARTALHVLGPDMYGRDRREPLANYLPQAAPAPTPPPFGSPFPGRSDKRGNLAICFISEQQSTQ